MTTKRETIAVFGITGRTGREFGRLALQEGYHVRALVRTPSKAERLFADLNDATHLQLVEGDLESTSALETVVEGAEYVVCMLAASVRDGVYPKDFMLNFVKRLLPILDQSATKVLLYQAGSMSADGNGYLHPVAWTMKQTLGRKLNIFPKINDNNEAIQCMALTPKSFHFVVTRAGVLKEAPSEKTVEASGWVRLRCALFSFCKLFTNSTYPASPPNVSCDVCRLGGILAESSQRPISL